MVASLNVARARFLVVGDTVQLETVVNNRSDKDVDVDVSIAATGLKLANTDPQPLTVIQSSSIRSRSTSPWKP